MNLLPLFQTIFLFIFLGIAPLFALATEVDPSDLYSPATFEKTTQRCHFSEKKRGVDRSTSPSRLMSSLIDLQRKYPLNFDQANDSSFLEKLSEAFFKNEANCKTKNLIFWGSQEHFPSLGLLHALWLPPHSKEIYQETFLTMIRFIEEKLARHSKLNHLHVPAWVWQSQTSPWSTKSEFDKIRLISLKMETAYDSFQLYEIKQQHPMEYTEAFRLFELRHFLALAPVIELQTLFSLQRAQQSLWNILALADQESQKTAARLHQNIQQLLKTPEGFLSLIDYVNFKGDGLNLKEVTPLGQHSWGLKAVLETMDQLKVDSKECLTNTPDCASLKFSESAICHLQRVAKFSGEDNSPEQIQRYVWLNGGWKNRIEQNYRPSTFHVPRCYPSPMARTPSSHQEAQ